MNRKVVLLALLLLLPGCLTEYQLAHMHALGQDMQGFAAFQQSQRPPYPMTVTVIQPLRR